jgi:CBS domain containing-hemolysin-like protein
MDPYLRIVLKLLAVAALVLVNGFFVAAEFVLVRIRDTQLAALADKGHRRARLAREVVAHLNSYLGATQLGITAASLGLGWIGEPVFLALLGPVFGWLHWDSPHLQHTVAFIVGFAVITFLHITAGELAPKWLAIQRPLPLALWLVPPLRWFYIVSFPFSWLLNAGARWFLARLGLQPVAGGAAHSEEELRLLVAGADKETGSTKLGRDIVLNALDLRRRVVREVLRPRHEIVGLNTEATMAECLDLAEKTRFSRFPLCEEGDLDRTLGVVHIKDLYALRLKAGCGRDLLPAARKIVYVPESARLEKLLQLLLERKLHFALVVDEYGGTLGMVTLENVLEELVGQIQDEFDQEKPLLVRTGEGLWMVDGALPLRELEDLTGKPIAAGDVTTVNGWVTQELGGFPKTGDLLRIGPHELRVEEMDGLRLARLSLKLGKPAAAAEAETAH